MLQVQIDAFWPTYKLSNLARGLDYILTEEVKKHTVIYVDDILCFSQNEEEHIVHLKNLLDNLSKANITVNLKKSQFFRKEIQYLGYCLTTNGIKPTTDKVSPILNFPTPRNPKQKVSWDLPIFIINSQVDTQLSLIHI